MKTLGPELENRAGEERRGEGGRSGEPDMIQHHCLTSKGLLFSAFVNKPTYPKTYTNREDYSVPTPPNPHPHTPCNKYPRALGRPHSVPGNCFELLLCAGHCAGNGDFRGEWYLPGPSGNSCLAGQSDCKQMVSVSVGKGCA